VRGRTGQAIELMVWQGMTRREAANAVGLNEKTLYNAFAMPRVKAFYGRLLEALRTSEKAKNIHRLCAIRDAADNQPAVQAIKVLEQMEEVSATGALNRAPGLQIVITQGPAVSQRSEPLVIEPIEPLPQRVR
jgi:hypothetical protein